ncbi:MAG: hypothetical protein LC650_02510 [Actinobacteria bacterium]|nr:hypothetical protein [Actinomycetota bacterium]
MTEEQKSIVWKEVEEKNVETWWKPEQVGDQVQGVVVDKFTIGDEDKVALDTGTGVIGLPSHKLLMKKLSAVDVGTPVRITLTGKEQNAKKQTYFLWKVERGEVEE